MINTNLSSLEYSNRIHYPKTQITDSMKNNINRLVNESENIASTLELQTEFANSKGGTEVLMAVSAHQKQIVAKMMSSNPEDAIALTLAASIEAYAKKLEEINAWTEGGVAVLDSMISMIYQSILDGGVDGTEYEDIMQILIIDLLSHQDEWGLTLDSSCDVYFAQITEHFGSGLHAPYGQYTNHPPVELIDWFLYDLIPELANQVPNQIPSYSMTAQIIAFYGEPANQEGLELCADNYWTDANGFINGSDENVPEDCERLSPILKVFILSDATEEGAITAEDWNQLISGDVSDYENLLELEDGELGEYLMTEIDGWAPSNGAYSTGESGEHIEEGRYPDYTNSAGIYPQDLINRLENFPGRDLTQEEIEEVNRIGDQVKVLQNTLLYWLKICRDEQLAIAQNI